MTPARHMRFPKTTTCDTFSAHVSFYATYSNNLFYYRRNLYCYFIGMVLAIGCLFAKARRLRRARIVNKPLLRGTYGCYHGPG